jgi:hypothetical protein
VKVVDVVTSVSFSVNFHELSAKTQLSGPQRAELEWRGGRITQLMYC